MAKKQRVLLVVGIGLVSLIWLVALSLLVSQPGSSVGSAALPTLVDLPSTAPGENQSTQIQSPEPTPIPLAVSHVDNAVTSTSISDGITADLVETASDPIVVDLPTEPVPNTVIIRFKPGSSQEERAAYVASIGGQVTQRIDALDTVIVALNESAGPQALPESSIIADSEADYYVSVAGFFANDPFYQSQWALDVIGAPLTWVDLPPDLPEITVAVVDSGICAAHPDLQGRIASTGWDFVEGDATPQDAFGHGCGVAGVIAANANNGLGIVGVAPNVEIMPLRVLDAQGVGTYSRVASAIIYAVDHDAKIINLSLGGSNVSQVLENAVDYAISHGVMVIAAAGNTGTEAVMYPAAYDPVIAVGSIDADLQRSDFSSYGPAVDVFAPGRDIMTTSLDGYTHLSGTSLAAPHVAGVAAVEIARGGSLRTGGGVLSFNDLPSDVETPPTDDEKILTCDMEQVKQAETAYLEAVSLNSESPPAASDAAVREAGQAYLAATAGCFEMFYNGGPIFIDGGGQYAGGGDPYAQFQAFGTKWGANSPYNPARPPGVAGGVVTFSFMRSNVNLGGEEGVDAGQKIVAIDKLPGQTIDEEPVGGCDLKQEIRSAFAFWSNVANIQFEERTDNNGPFNHPDSNEGLIRIGAHVIDGVGNELGHAYFPPPVPGEEDPTGTGDIHFDSAENWGCESGVDSENRPVIDLGIVALHEIGHAIGLSHQTIDVQAVMNPVYNATITGLFRDDEDGVKAVYGVAPNVLTSPPLLLPANEAVIGNNIPTFEWGQSGADQYQIQVDDSPDFASPAIDTSVAPPLVAGPVSFSSPSALVNGTYYWRVRGFKGGPSNWSTSRSFTVSIGVPSLISPANGATLSSNSVVFEWSDIPGDNNQFRLQIATGSEFVGTSIKRDLTVTNSLTTTVSSLNDGVYFWRMQADGGDWSLPSQFTLDSNVPDLHTPIVTGNQVTFTWDPIPGATEYQLQIDTSPNFVGLLFLDKLFLDKLFLDKLFLDKLFLDKLFLDKLFLDKLFLDKLFLDKLFLDKLFLDKLFLDKITTPTHTLTKPLSEGLHYWRVRARYANKAWSGWSETPTVIVNTRENVVINEIHVDDPSWIELYNAHVADVDLSDWQLIVYMPNGTVALTYNFPDGFVLGKGKYVTLYEANGTETDSELYLGANTFDWPLSDSEPLAQMNPSAGAFDYSQPSALEDRPLNESLPNPAPDAEVPLPAQAQFAEVSGQATNIVVNTTSMVVADDGACSLIEAIVAANLDTPSGSLTGECPPGSGSDTITLSPGATYTLTSVNNTTNGPNGLPLVTSPITIAGSGATIARSGVAPNFRIFYVDSTGSLTLNDLTISGGNPGVSHVGGAVISYGNLTVNNSTVSANNAVGGGGIYAFSNTVTVSKTTFTGNLTTGDAGGAVQNNGSTMTISNSTFSGNSAVGGGGAISNRIGSVTINNSTFSGNTSGFAGGGIENQIHFGSVVTLRNSILTNNTGGNCSGSINNDGNNLQFSDNTCGALIPVSNPLLGSLTGSPAYFPLSSGSPAINAGNNATCTSTDQRGVLRPQGANCDIGAYEYRDADIVVNTASMNMADDGVCSLLEAFNAANTNVASGETAGECIPSDRPADTIVLQAETTYTLDGDTLFGGGATGSNGLPIVTSSIVVDGSSAIIQRNPSFVCLGGEDPQFRILQISGGDLTLNDVTVKNGCNTATIGGGGIWVASGTLTIDGGIVSSNLSTSGGGGIRNDGTVFVNDSTVDSNTATGGFGGGIDNVFGGTLTIANSTISNNISNNRGGGVSNYDAGSAATTVTITNSTISGNQAFARGGGLHNLQSGVGAVTMTLNNVTIANNSAAAGGGIDNSAGVITLQNTLTADSPNGGDCTGTLNSLGHNLFENTVGCTITGVSTGNVTDVDPALAPLADYGGSTLTHALGANSPALDAGNSATCLASDQRGVSRPDGAGCDIGAFEGGMSFTTFGTIGGALALVNPGGMDFVQFGNARIAPPTGTGWTGATVALPNAGQTIGRDPASSDADHVTDWFSQKSSRGGQNAVQVVINEIFPGNVDAIELFNPGFETVKMGGWQLIVYDMDGNPIAGAEPGVTYRFADDFTLAPGSYVVLYESSGTDTNTQLYMNVAVAWANWNARGAVALTNGLAGIDFMRFGDSGITDLSVSDVQPPEGTGWTGVSPIAPLPNQAVGRDSESTDTDDGSDWFTQSASLGSRNPLIRPAANDRVNNPIIIPKVPFRNTQDTVAATVTDDEPVPSCGFNVGHSVWYRLTPTSSGELRFQTDGSDYNTVLAIWTGLTTEVACDDDSAEGTRSRIDLLVNAGTTYYIMVGGALNEAGNLVFSVKPPRNDDFDDAIVVNSLPFSDAQQTLAASIAQSDPVPGCGVNVGRTVWYRYTATTDYPVRFQTGDSNYDTVLSVWTGTRGSLVQVACDNDGGADLTSSVTFRPVPGTTYYVMAGGNGAAGGNLIIDGSLLIAPENDDFDNAAIVTFAETSPGSNVFLPYTFEENTAGATNEALDPEPSCNINVDATVWFKYQAINNGTVVFQTVGSEFDTVLSVWTSLTPEGEVACNDDLGLATVSYVEVATTIGTTYYIMVGGHQGDNGHLRLDAFMLSTPPVNDEPDTNAILIDPLPFEHQQITTGATKSIFEPTPSCNANVGKTVWFRYLATEAQLLRFQTTGSSFDTVLSVWQSDGNQLQEVACNDDSGEGKQSDVTVSVFGGSTYYVMVGGLSSESGSLVFKASEIPTAPSNDDFDSPEIISSLPYTITQNNITATNAFDDPVPSCGKGATNTLWYSFTATTTDLLNLETSGSDFDTSLSVWTGARGSLSEVACDDDSGAGLTSYLELLTAPGTTYYIMVGGSNGDTGEVILQAGVFPPPANDDFDNAVVVSSVPFNANQTTKGATDAVDDPVPTCNTTSGDTVWYRFTPAIAGTLRITTQNSGFNTVLAVYTGPRGSLTEVACNDNSGGGLLSRIDNLPVMPGIDYHIMVGGSFGQSGSLELAVDLIAAPTNDDFDNALEITPLPYTDTRSTDGASNASDDPSSCGFSASKTIWYRYTAASSGLLRLSLNGTDFDTVMAVYTGTRGSLNVITCEVFDSVDVATQAGTTYYVMIGGWNGQSGTLHLQASLLPTPANDMIDGAIVIPSLPYSNTQDTTAASKIGDPRLSCDFSVGKSVWYRYTAVDPGLLRFNTNGSSFSTVMAVFVDNGSGPVEVACGVFRGVEVPAVPGTTYLVMVGGRSGAGGNLVINAEQVVSPANDDFDLAEPITALPAVNLQDTLGASNAIDDPLSCGIASGKTVWYQYTATGSGLLEVQKGTANFGVVVAVYTGSRGNLRLVSCNTTGNTSFNVTAGKTYYIMLAGRNNTGGSVQFTASGTIVPVPPSISVTKTANPETVTEPGGNVTFDIEVENTSFTGSVTVTSLSDDVYGDVANRCNAALPVEIAPGEKLTCSYTEMVSGQPNTNVSNTVTAAGQHSSGTPVGGSATATVSIANVESSILVTKTANPTSVNAPGANVTFTVEVENTSPVDQVTVNTVTDSEFGAVTDCAPALSAALAPGETLTCSFTQLVEGESGDIYSNIVTVEAIDDDGIGILGSAIANVDILCGDPDPKRDLIGSLPSRSHGVIVNTSPSCSYPVGMASYKRFNEVIDDQEIFDWRTTEIGPGETVNFNIDIPECALQIDLFYGEVLLSLDGQRYGERLLRNRYSWNLPYCEDTTGQVVTSSSLPSVPAPTILAASAVESQVTLTWEMEPADGMAIDVERSQDGGNEWTAIGSLTSDHAAYLDDTTACFTGYFYRIRSVDLNTGLSSNYTDAVNVITSCAPLPAPSNLVATAATQSQIEIAWTSSSPDTDRYHVERSADGVEWIEVGMSAAAYIDTGLTCGTAYQYRVRAFSSDAGQYSDYSDIVSSATAPCLPPPAPANLSAIVVAPDQIDLSWDPAEGAYLIMRVETSSDGANWVESGQTMDNTISYVDGTMACDMIYHFRVRAYRVSDSMYSEYSNVVSAVTPECPVVPLAVKENIVSLYKDGVWRFLDSSQGETSHVMLAFGIAEPGWLPVVGDWNGDGVDGIGLYKDGAWLLRDTNGSGVQDMIFSFGPAGSGWLPVVGDWNGDGVDGIGLYKDGAWLLRNNNVSGEAEVSFTFGQAIIGALPVAGDWNGDNVDTVGLYSGGVWYLHHDFASVDTAQGFSYGPSQSAWRPVIGDWDVDGVDTIGLYKDGVWRLRNANVEGPTDVGFNFGDAGETWMPVGRYQGSWDALNLIAQGGPVKLPVVTPTEAPTEAPTEEATEISQPPTTPTETPTDDEVTPMPESTAEPAVEETQDTAEIPVQVSETPAPTETVTLDTATPIPTEAAEPAIVTSPPTEEEAAVLETPTPEGTEVLSGEESTPQPPSDSGA